MKVEYVKPPSDKIPLENVPFGELIEYKGDIYILSMFKDNGRLLIVDILLGRDDFLSPKTRVKQLDGKVVIKKYVEYT